MRQPQRPGGREVRDRRWEGPGEGDVGGVEGAKGGAAGGDGVGEGPRRQGEVVHAEVLQRWHPLGKVLGEGREVVAVEREVGEDGVSQRWDGAGEGVAPELERLERGERGEGGRQGPCKALPSEIDGGDAAREGARYALVGAGIAASGSGRRRLREGSSEVGDGVGV